MNLADLSDSNNWVAFIDRHGGNWETISKIKYLPAAFVEKFQDKLDWKSRCLLFHLNEDQIGLYSHLIGWLNISWHCRLSEAFIETHKDDVNWNWISCCQKLSEVFIERHKDRVDWPVVSANQKLSEAFIEKFHDRVYWCKICMYQKLSEAFILLFDGRVDWRGLSYNAKVRLSSTFYKRFGDLLDWNFVSVYHSLLESEIEEFAELVDWKKISQYQDLSDEFIVKHLDCLDPDALMNNNFVMRRRLQDVLCWNIGTISEKAINHFSRDVSNEILHYLYYLDPLTGLLNYD